MRVLFLLDPYLCFLNHGSSDACSREVLDDPRRWQDEMARKPVAFLGGPTRPCSWGDPPGSRRVLERSEL